ncbi:rod shape-determining protein MreC [Shewanella inventionis]|uniref:Cell shape-determining protein MreC n=1 Tax=Shewanella inventionis TaxID=1738770 RepID=A0ABQ1J8K4_9GAMM|nr:rod shape-determining protein MreC [Shewanella inventionis]MCL1157985.1 rod shape-determining protein MreC [Shewanella inventionis]GGB62706.1 rod shape-determining protein MreC [Shewanella inventionis]
MKPIFVRGVSNQFRLTLAIILSVALLAANHRLDPIRQSLSSVLSPLQYLANVPGVMLDWSAEAFATRNMLELQNKELLRQQLVMSERLQRFEHVRQENERLRALLGSPVHMDSRKVVAEVMEVASDPFRQFVVLNHGSQTGVYVGQPVVDAQGVVGQVIEVSEFTSRVLMVSDTSHGIPVRVTRNDVRAIANGTGDIDQIELRHVAKSTDIIAGDLLVTSGLGNRFPEGYPVARVISVSRDDGQSYAVINAQPLAALDRIRYVLLIWPDETTPFTLPADLVELIEKNVAASQATGEQTTEQQATGQQATSTTGDNASLNQPAVNPAGANAQNPTVVDPTGANTQTSPAVNPAGANTQSPPAVNPVATNDHNQSSSEPITQSSEVNQ